MAENLKENERLKKIRDHLLLYGKATWTDISTATNIQPKELASDLRKLMDKREIATEPDKKDRRKTWYMLRDKNKATMESKRYEATKFIENMKEPIYHEVQRRKGKYRILVASFSEYPRTQHIDRAKAQEIYEKILSQSATGMSSEFWLSQIEPVDKLALVFAFEKIQRGE